MILIKSAVFFVQNQVHWDIIWPFVSSRRRKSKAESSFFCEFDGYAQMERNSVKNSVLKIDESGSERMITPRW